MHDLPVINRDLTGQLPGVVLLRSATGGRTALAHARCTPPGGWVVHALAPVYIQGRDGYFWNHCAVCELPLVRVD